MEDLGGSNIPLPHINDYKMKTRETDLKTIHLKKANEDRFDGSKTPVKVDFTGGNQLSRHKTDVQRPVEVHNLIKT